MQRSLLALGSNLGNRAAAIHAALTELGAKRGVGVLRRVSHLYDTAPQYVTDQPRFLNAVCEVETTLGPVELLHAIKQIEAKLGRPIDGAADPATRFGPRTIDIDMLAYGEAGAEVAMRTEQLTLPHPRVAERAFVLRPLADICPERPWANTVAVSDSKVSGSGGGRHTLPTVAELLAALGETALGRAELAALQRVLPLGGGARRGGEPSDKESLVRWGERTLLMAVVNTTPDSFSDGGRHGCYQRWCD